MHRHAIPVDRQDIENDAVIERNPVADARAVHDAAERMAGNIEGARHAPAEALADAENIVMLHDVMGRARPVGFKAEALDTESLLPVDVWEMGAIDAVF